LARQQQNNCCVFFLLRYIPAMIIAYGYNRSDRDFRHVDHDRLFLDAAGKRDEWSALATGGGLVKGDTLVVVSEHDLGRAARLVSIKSTLRDMGVTLCAKPLPVPAYTPYKGTKHWRPCADELAFAKQLWRNGLLSQTYVQDRIADEQNSRGWTKLRPTRNQLNRACGPRNKQEGQRDG
jgi:hypothetical protein